MGSDSTSGDRVVRYWVSWVQATDDPRPLTFPPNEGVLGWWCSGESDEGSHLCALLAARDETDAEEVVRRDWPEFSGWRFCQAVPRCFELSDRFPLEDWMRERIQS